MLASSLCVQLVADQESYLATHKPDTDGTPTIGYGHQDPKLQFSRLTKAEALELLRSDLAFYGAAVTRLVTVPLAQHEFDSLTSLTFNAGVQGLAGSKLRAKLNAGNRAGALLEFDDWHHYRDANGVVHESANLQRRRAIERDLFEGYAIDLAMARPGACTLAERLWRASATPVGGSGSSGSGSGGGGLVASSTGKIIVGGVVGAVALGWLLS